MDVLLRGCVVATLAAVSTPVVGPVGRASMIRAVESESVAEIAGPPAAVEPAAIRAPPVVAVPAGRSVPVSDAIVTVSDSIVPVSVRSSSSSSSSSSSPRGRRGIVVIVVVVAKRVGLVVIRPVPRSPRAARAREPSPPAAPAAAAAAAAVVVPVAPALAAPPVPVVIAAAVRMIVPAAKPRALVFVPARVVPAVVPVVARAVRRALVPVRAALASRVCVVPWIPQGWVIARVQPSLAPEPRRGFVSEEEVARRARRRRVVGRGRLVGALDPVLEVDGSNPVVVAVRVARGSGRVRARRPRGAGAMERSPRLVGGLRRLLSCPSLVFAGFLAGPAPRDAVRNQLRVRIVPGVLLRW